MVFTNTAWLSIVLVAACTCYVQAATTGLQFKEAVANAPFPVRENAHLHTLSNNQTYIDPSGKNLTAPAGSMVFYGGEFDCVNDVWLATAANLTSYIFIAGLTGEDDCDGPVVKSPFPVSSYNSVQGATYCSDPVTDTTYLLGGWSETTAYQVNDVWHSTDHLHWFKNNQAGSKGNFVPLDSAGCVVINDAAHTLFLYGGNAVASEPWIYNPLNTVWTSVDNGQTWELVKTKTPFTARLDHVALTATSGNNTILFALGGSTVNTTTQLLQATNDLYFSVDLGVTWSTIAPKTVWTPRERSAGILTKDGVIAIVGGMEVTVNGTEELAELVNEVWISFDLAQTWYNCTATQTPLFTAREYPSVALDASGFMYVIAGRNNWPMPQYNDIWVSTTSLYDLKGLAAACGASASDLEQLKKNQYELPKHLTQTTAPAY